ncbi:hypothetical protein ACEZHJ_00695 [Arhodomonas sp. KWT2]|uniref:hypothetical protein n=1 Tax=unclassified Arhodomonas TaxID=2621637 RepID=UPI0013D5D87F|nr:hypothetical protein [Arhodomonas sp. KWT]
MDNVRESAYRVIKTVASPLRFFAVAAISLALIIIVLAWKSSLPPEVTVSIITAAFIVLLILIVLVAILVVFWPKKLVFDQEAHLTVLREKLGDNELPVLYEPGALPNVSASNAIDQQGDEK